MNDYIDLYCERIIPGLWSEPFNAISNISFFIAAAAIWHVAKSQQKIPIGIWILISLAISIGIGSTLFHTFATKWANLLDVLPIMFFQLCFLWLYSRHVMKMKYIYTGSLIIVFYFASNYSKQFTNLFNGSLSYLPAFLVLLGFGIYHFQQQKCERFILLGAAGVFLLALSFRSFDQIVCYDFSTGTHFIWHLLNGILLYLSARGLILNWSIKAET
ncbi:ceramidase domain-containing protein [Sphaerospermopsis aphanizomenoides BCCUSP55]|uniref:ceramidase domain-containing protein n=1 Tax=Sphaerospermopsis aphanizomenoides TaxID=459663 RepID=UPI000A6E1293|nr:ceramidase domain-containing protein [Sphaerospermopsis aphanizomenoides]MBK1989493.1 ceramidase domain-containing protein [Sphaerospermopsis aphanizomenoides BCCUSP55]